MVRVASGIVRYANWWISGKTLVASQLLPMRLEASGQLPFRGEIQAQAISGLAVVMISGHGVHGSHGRAEVARMDKHFHVASVHLDGETRLIHRDEQVSLRRGDERRDRQQTPSNVPSQPLRNYCTGNFRSTP